MRHYSARKTGQAIFGILFTIYLALLFLLNGHIHIDVTSFKQFSGNNYFISDDKGLYMEMNDCNSEKTNFVFIKCMKCATETMATIIRRFGYVRDLNFALPVKRNLYLGWPFPIQLEDVRPSKFEYNILMEHSVYNGSLMRSFMPRDTVFITIIRHPWNQFKSTFNYFNLAGIVKIPNKNFTEYLKNMEFYEAIYKNPENNKARWCIPDGFSITKNIMSHCLGMPVGFPKGRGDISENMTLIQHYVRSLNNEFYLVMIADYFQESLILLKIKMCWGFKDILYHKSNVGQYEYKSLGQGHLYDIHRHWSKADYILFEHFNKTLWNKIKLLGQRFYEELELFKGIQTSVEQFCFAVKKPTGNITIPASTFDREFNVTDKECQLMKTYMLPMLWARYYEKEGMEPENFGKPEKRPKPRKGCSI